LVFLVTLSAISTPLVAQDRHAVDRSALAAAVTQHVAKDDVDRDSVKKALAQPAVREMAMKAGVNLTHLTAAVDTMSGTDLQRAARAAGDVNQALAGGASTVTISTTTIIIGLLILILIIVAVN